MKYDVIMRSWGGTERVLMRDVTLEEATEFCESHNWEWDNGGGYIWDLAIDEREEEE